MKAKAKGARAERKIVALHKEIGVYAEKVAGSGAFTGARGRDVDVYIRGRDEAPMVSEVKAKQGAIPKTLIAQMGDNDLLFIKPDREEPYVFMPWRTYAELVRG